MSRARVALRLALLPSLVVVALVLAWRFGYFRLGQSEQLHALVPRARDNPWAGALYVIAYVFIATLGLPITVLSVVGGALFGTMRGMLLAWTGAMIGTVTAHLLARSIGQGPVRRFLGRHHLLGQLRKRSDFWTLLRLRVLPVAPFAVLDYVAGFVGTPLRRLLLATAIGVLPTVVAYSYAGAELASGLDEVGQPRLRAFWIAGLVTVVMICLSLLPRMIRRARARRR